MPLEYKYEISDYSITMMKNGFGWIQLKDKNEAAGYIYFSDEIGADRFGGLRTPHPYVVMHLPKALWDTIIDILRNESPLYIRGYRPDGVEEVTAFFGTSTDEPVGEGE